MNPRLRSWTLDDAGTGASEWPFHRTLKAAQHDTYLLFISESLGQGLAILEFLSVVLQTATWLRQGERGEGGGGEGGGERRERKTYLGPVTKQ